MVTFLFPEQIFLEPVASKFLEVYWTMLKDMARFAHWGCSGEVAERACAPRFLLECSLLLFVFSHFFPKFWISYWVWKCDDNMCHWQIHGSSQENQFAGASGTQSSTGELMHGSQKSGVHQLRLVVFIPTIWIKKNYTSQVVVCCLGFLHYPQYHFQHGFLGLRDVRASPELVEPIGLQVVEPELSLEAAGRWELLKMDSFSEMCSRKTRKWSSLRPCAWPRSCDVALNFWPTSWFVDNLNPQSSMTLSLSISSILRSEGKATESGSLSERPNTTFTSEYFELV